MDEIKTLELKVTGTINEIKFRLEAISNSIADGYNIGMDYSLKEYKEEELKKNDKDKN